MKVYKIEVLVIDFEDVGPDEVKSVIENSKYINASVMSTTERDIGVWYDDHPLNKHGMQASAYHDIFSKKAAD